MRSETPSPCSGPRLSDCSTKRSSVPFKRSLRGSFISSPIEKLYEIDTIPRIECQYEHSCWRRNALLLLALGFLVPAFAGAVFLFGAAQHRDRAFRAQVGAGHDDRIQEGHRGDVRTSERRTAGGRHEIVVALQGDRCGIAVGNPKRRNAAAVGAL